ncbi:organic cation transporter 1-like [Tigriopus californicus]|uniref:organic cation transporter 1-like n=1 Tax=Tigriopus californicus TaxID=6832 RepID=UPI0027D9F4C6|nr:organic cation transporter 1-like [Tigriopus californicus]
MQMNWVCDESWKPAFTQSMFFFGGIIGTLFFGYAADHFGRLWALYSANGLLLVTGLATPFCQNFVAFTVIRFLMGLTHTTFFSVFFLLTLENVSIEKRSFIGNISLAVALTVGGVYQPWLLKYLQDWKIWHHALFIQVLFAIVPRGFIHESVRWLASEGRVEESIEVLKAIAKFNKKTVEPHIYKSFEKLVIKEKSHESQKSWLDLFRTPRLRRNTILMIITWMCISSMFDGHIRNISNLKYSIYWTFSISAALELPADLCTVWSLNALGRRWSAFLSMTLSALAMIVCGFNLHNIPLATVFAMMGRFFITFAMNTGAQISFEIVPTELRGQGNALANVFALGANFFSPYIVYSSKAWESLPFMILALGSLFGAVTALFLPETADVDLPDTIEEAEEFDKHHTFFYVPIVHKWRAKKEAKEEARRNFNIPQITFSENETSLLSNRPAKAKKTGC